MSLCYELCVRKETSQADVSVGLIDPSAGRTAVQSVEIEAMYGAIYSPHSTKLDSSLTLIPCEVYSS
jgi:hypothetical protein